MANILVVDDSKFMRKMLSDILIGEAHQILAEAENGKEAIELYERLKPDVVTLDIIMPEVEGVDAISALKAMRKANPRAKVVMVSAMGQEKVVEECLQAGASGFVVKPFQPSDVAGTVQTVLKKY
jgi:two-component system chemotaxis response regulator CheY